MLPKDSYGKLHVATIDVADTIPIGADLPELNVSKPMAVRSKQNPTSPSAGSVPPPYGRLIKNPHEVEDLYLVVHYKLALPEE
jgi:hypothetical protein